MPLSPAHIVSFLRDARQELRGVQWPTRAVTVQFTVLILVVVAVVAIATGAFDIGLTFLVERFLLR